MIGKTQPPEHIARDKPDSKAASMKTKPEEDKAAESVNFRDIFFKKYTERK